MNRIFLSCFILLQFATYAQQKNIRLKNETVKTATEITQKSFLTPHGAYALKPHQQAHTLRKDNTLSWKSNFYSCIRSS